MHCPKCGTACTNAAFCPNCGAKLAPPPSTSEHKPLSNDGTCAQHASTVPPLHIPIPPTEKAKPGALLRKCVGNLLLVAVVLAGLWFWRCPSKDDIRQAAQKYFLELFQENQWDITEADIKEFTLVSKSWLKSYVGIFTLKVKDSAIYYNVPVEVLVEDGLFEYQVMLSIEAAGILTLNAYFSDDEE